MNERAFTFKSILAGLCCSLLIVIFAEHNKLLGQPPLVGTYLPLFGMLLICALSFAWNALAGRISKSLTLSHRELVVVLGMIFITAWIPGPNLMRSLVPQMALPQYKGVTSPTWKDADILSHLPKALLPQGPEGGVDDTIHIGLLQGLGKEAGISDMPFQAWIGPGLTWGAIIALLVGAIVSLTLIVHRQWAHHEQLRYPLASVADALLAQSPKKGYSALFANPLFWFGFVPVFFILSLNGLGKWFPDTLPKVALEYGIGWGELFPIINTSGHFCVGWINITFIIIGIAYFIPSDVGFSMGVSTFVTALLAAQFYLVTGSPVAADDLTLFRAGGYLGFLLIMIYTGRTYYYPVLLKAFGLGRKLSCEAGAVMAARIFFLAYAGLILMLKGLGLDLFIGFLYVSLLLTMFLVIARLVCESGMPNLVPGWAPSGLLIKLLGPAAIGAGPMTFILYLGSILATGISATTLMPYLATAIKVGEDNEVNQRRFLPLLQGIMILALVVGFGATLYTLYRNGAGNVTARNLDMATRHIFTLQDRGQLDASSAATGLGKLSLAVFDLKTSSFFGAGLIAVVLTYLVRFRSSKWPIHPILFVTVGLLATYSTWFCFLAGWLIKNLVVKFGGGTSYQKYKPIFLGLILGEVAVYAMMSLAALLYHSLTGGTPPGVWTIYR
ncbi:MAG: DUF6785 family protein [Planctomycetota bacterium]|jgi:hypothetical protein